MSGSSAEPSTLTLHAIRLLGFAEAQRIAHRYGLDAIRPWSACSTRKLTGGDPFRVRRNRRLEPDRARSSRERTPARGGARRIRRRSALSGVYERFLPSTLASRTLRPGDKYVGLPWDPMAANDHTDFGWDDRVIATLGSIGRKLAPLESELAAAVPRFGGYAARYEAALARVTRGEPDGSTG